MTVPAKLAFFAVVLAVALGIGAVLGVAVGPIDVGDGDHGAVHHEEGVDHGE